MLIKYWHNSLTAPVTRTYSPKILFWLGLSLTFAAIYGILGLQQAFSSEYVVSSDAQLHVFWMRRFLDPELFPNDLLADFYQSIAPWGYTTLYKLFAALGSDPLFLSKLLPIVLGLITTGYSFGICMQVLPVPAAGFFATLMLNQALWMGVSLATGTPVAFSYPLLVAFFYYLLRRSLLPCLVAIALQGLFYPSCVFISVGVLILQLVSWERWRFSLSQNRKDYWFSVVGIGVALLILLPYSLKTSEFGSAIPIEQLRTISRSQSFPEAPSVGCFSQKD